jgi:glycosyltransferase involved in cell wall biosynthesis
MRIAQVSPLYERVPPVAYGGTERVVSYLTEGLVRRGHEVTLFATGDSITSATLVAGAPRGLRLEADCTDAIIHHVAMIDEVLQRAGDFDVLHFHTDYLHFPLLAHLDLPALTTLHGRLDLPDYVRCFRRFADLDFVSISDAQRTPMPWLSWTSTVYHGLPPDLHTPVARTGDYLAFLGRMSPEKGFEDAVEIARRAGLPLRCAGKLDRNDQTYIDEKVRPLLASPGIEYVGEIGGRDKDEFLGGAAALLFPICWPEPFGLVMIEAMACGTPVVAFRAGSVPEVIDEGITGFIVDDVDAAVRAVPRALALDRGDVRATFDRRFSAERMVDDYLEIYRELVARGRGHGREQLAIARPGGSGARAALRASGS